MYLTARGFPILGRNLVVCACISAFQPHASDQNHRSIIFPKFNRWHDLVYQQAWWISVTTTIHPNLVATIWRDKKDVKMLSTLCDPNSTQTVERKQKDGSKIRIPCPDAVVVYKFMGGVDLGDQLQHYYHIRTKCVKNYKYIFKFVVAIGITNAHILSQYSGPPALQFLHSTILHLPSHQAKKGCIYCQENSRRWETVWYCSECEGG